MKLGIIGLPNVGKSTLFNAITNQKADAQNYPFCTIDPNVGLVEVPDPRLKVLAEYSHAKRIVPAAIEFYDIAGLVRGASKGEGLGNKFLANIREVAAIVHVLRLFEDENVVHVDGSVDPERDIETIETELIFADLEVLEKRKTRLEKQIKGDKTLAGELDFTKKLIARLEDGTSARGAAETEEEAKWLQEMQLLTAKPVIYVANVSEDDLKNPESLPAYRAVEEIAAKSGARVLAVSAAIEAELSTLDPDDRAEYLRDLGVESSGLERLIRVSYDLLGLMSFITTGEIETRAWTIKKNTRAQNAAGKIHSDIERGFIRAEIISYDVLIGEAEGSMQKAREKGLIRSEGKDYIMQEGDIVLFRFNV